MLEKNKEQNASEKRLSVFYRGLTDGVPIALGYFAVSFSLGIAARKAGVSVIEAMVCNLLTFSSTGSYAVFTAIASTATIAEILLVSLIVNARYLLMSCALSQRMEPSLSLFHRLLLSLGITDEIFGITIAQQGPVKPLYGYGAMLISMPAWSLGAGIGVIMGSVLPVRVVSALSVALYGMFIAIIVPPAKIDKVIAGCIIASFALSCLIAYFPLTASISSSTKTIVLTILISAAAAYFFPVIETEAGQ